MFLSSAFIIRAAPLRRPGRSNAQALPAGVNIPNAIAGIWMISARGVFPVRVRGPRPSGARGSIGGGTHFAVRGDMHVLEARFHSRSAEDSRFVVGRVVWKVGKRMDDPLVQPSTPAMDELGPDALVTKLRYIVRVTAAGSFDRCRSLRSRFWSFVDVTREVEMEVSHGS